MGVSSLGIRDEIASGQDLFQVQGFWSAVEHKIVFQSPSRWQMKLIAALYVSPGNKKKLNINLSLIYKPLKSLFSLLDHPVLVQS